jgi:hypothetical protein
MIDPVSALKITQGLLIALQAYETIGGDVQSLLTLRANAKAEGREISEAEVQSLLDEAQSALDQLDADLKKNGNA